MNTIILINIVLDNGWNRLFHTIFDKLIHNEIDFHIAPQSNDYIQRFLCTELVKSTLCGRLVYYLPQVDRFGMYYKSIEKRLDLQS